MYSLLTAILNYDLFLNFSFFRIYRTKDFDVKPCQRLEESNNNHKNLNLGDVIPTKLMTHNKQVEMVNKSEYDNLNSTDEHVFDAVDSSTVEKIRATLDKLLHQVSRRLCLKKGAQGMGLMFYS